MVMINRQRHGSRAKRYLHILMGQSLVDVYLDSQNGDVSAWPHLADERDMTNRHRQWPKMTIEPSGQTAPLRPKCASDFLSSPESQIGMHVFGQTDLHQGFQFAFDLARRPPTHGQQTCLQPAIEVLDRSVAPRFVLRGKGEFDAEQQRQTYEAIERSRVAGMPESLVVVDLQPVGQAQMLPCAHHERQERVQLGRAHKLDIHGLIVDIFAHQKVPFLARPGQVARPNHIELMNLVAARGPQTGITARRRPWLQRQGWAGAPPACSTRSMVRNEGNSASR